MRAELIPVQGGEAIPITRDITLIGRREFCDIQLNDPSLSKRHCILVKTDGLLMVRDLATTNGTRVKGQMIRWAALLPNDHISLGKLKFRVFLGPDVASGPANPPLAQPRKSPGRTARPVKAGNLAPQPVAATVQEGGSGRQSERNKPRVDVDDSRWFDRMGAEHSEEQIIDLD